MVIGGHGLITRAGQGFKPLGRFDFGGRPGDLSAVGGSVDHHIFHARYSAQGGFNVQGTCSAVHALHHHLGLPCCGGQRRQTEGKPALGVVEQGVVGSHGLRA